MAHLSQKKYVELKVNYLLEIIRKHPKKTLSEIEIYLRENKSFEAMSRRTIRQYVNVLESTGYITKIGVHTKAYKIAKEGEFTYPNGVNNFVRLSKIKQTEALS